MYRPLDRQLLYSRWLGAEPPLSGSVRWVVRRKAQVVFAVRSGDMTLEEACTRYSLTAEEFRSWQTFFDSHGIDGLRATKLQHYR